MRKETILVNGKGYAVNIHLEIRNNARVSLGRSGVNIRIPLGLPREEMFKQTEQMKQWARKKLEKNPLDIKKKGSKEYNNGDCLIVGKDEYLLKINYSDKQSSSAKIWENQIFLNISRNLAKEKQNKHISVLLSRVVAKQKYDFITQRIKKLNEKHFCFNVNKIFLKYNQSNWGSCSSKGNINISTRLLFAPNGVVDYVIVHELVHLQEKNHSSAFWRLVEKAVPNYKEKQKWLKDNGNKCWF